MGELGSRRGRRHLERRDYLGDGFEAQCILVVEAVATSSMKKAMTVLGTSYTEARTSVDEGVVF